ncbi:MAG TPA: hypothetical protein VKF84_04380 [Candidatus Sulfotelmatobacter sp.]|nr:hypothetical protein [Candidatus Sulfotelmatobacter sp.]
MSEFEDFASEHSQRVENAKRLDSDTKPEWEILKQEAARFAAEGKEFDGEKFEWAPYAAYYPDFLKLGNVAATFLSRGTNGPRDFRIRLTRRPEAPGTMWVDEKSPLNTIEWSLKTSIQSDGIVWSVAEMNEAFSTAALAEKVAVELSKYHLAYKKYYENWSAA